MNGRFSPPAKTRRPYPFADWKAGKRPPLGWDVADGVEDGWTRGDITSWMKQCVSDTLTPFEESWPEDKPEAAVPDPEPSGVQQSPLERMTREWCFVVGRNAFRNIETGAEMGVGAFNLSFLSIIPEVDRTVAGRALKNPKAVPASEYLLGYAGGTSVQNTLYLPQQNAPVVEVDGVQYLNSYLPRYVPRAAATYAGHWAVEAWRDHLRTILPVDWELLLTWLAYNTQHPGKKILWAPIIRGTQGDGKTSISKMLGGVMGARNVKVVSTESLFSDFTGYAEGACVAFLEEIRVKGHNRHDAMNKLKPLITNEVVEVVRKGENGRNIPNVTNYMAFTNFEDALVIDANDRRWGVFFTRFKSREELTAAGLDSTYFDRLHAATEHHSGVLRAWLLAVDTSSFTPNAAPPLTAGKAAMIANSISPDAAMVAEMISLGRFGVAPHAVATDCLNVALRAEHGTSLPTSRMSMALAEMGWRVLDQQLKWRGKARRVYVDRAATWPADENRLRIAVREMLDGTVETGPVSDPSRPSNW